MYSLPAGSLVSDGDTGTASQHNTPLQDLETDMNTARPVVAGGTGATTASGARTNLDVPSNSEALLKTGGEATGAITINTSSAQPFGFWTTSGSATVRGAKFRLFDTAEYVAFWTTEDDGTLIEQVAAFEPTATSLASGVATSVVTKNKGDARYTLSSSQRFKEDIRPAEVGDINATLNFLANSVCEWTWGGELPDGDERIGRPGLGLVNEMVEPVLPEAVRPMNGKPDAVDPMPYIALLLLERQNLLARIDALESEVARIGALESARR